MGLVFRLPILYNFDWWERHPALPAMSTAAGCYYPPMAIYLISGSLNVDFVAWFLGRSSRYALYGLCVVLLTITRLMFLPVALLLYPSRKKLVLPIFPLPTIPTTPAVYSLTISQRVGMTVSWRISASRGYEFRTSYWFAYLPTLLHLFELFHQNNNNNNNNIKNNNSNNSRNKKQTPLSDTRLTNWLRRKTATLGVSAGGPIPMPPGYFVTAGMTMSGFHFRNPLKKGRLGGVANSASSSSSSSIQQTKTSLKEELEEESTPRKQKMVG